MKRRARKAGEWYEGNAKALAGQLEGWLKDAKVHQSAAVEPVRAIISPHAGYSYSGATAAWGFKHIDPSKIKRIFILGPSHHYYSKFCELTKASIYETPLGNLTVDKKVIEALSKTGAFKQMEMRVDEEEHSIELQLPYLAHMMKGQDFTVVPILVGGLTDKKEAEYGALLAPYLEDPENFFVISSDFCHWGARFDYTYYQNKKVELWQSIEELDMEGYKAIESKIPANFSAYLQKTENTICGRHPIGVLLNAIAASKLQYQVRLLHYAQSNHCKSAKDSSVSYVSALITSIPKKIEHKQQEEVIDVESNNKRPKVVE